MNNHETLSKMQEMRLNGMKQQFELILETHQHSEYTADEMLAVLIDSEYNDRHNRRLQRLLKQAKFRYSASIEEIDFASSRNLDKTQFLRLASCDFIKKHESVIITGPTGSGKSFLASALGHQACQDGFKVLYYNLGKLFAKLRIMKADTSDIREKDRIEKHDLLILDDFGLEMLDTQDRITLLEIIEDRHGKRSTIITSQLPVAKWYDVIGDPTIADAILDRIVHTAHRIELRGESLRKKGRAARASRS
jgi:DNA replication protein DnaC